MSAARWGRVSLKPLKELSPREWRRFYAYFKDREIADWNGARPIRIPEWLFQRIMLDEERAGERFGFGIFNEVGRFIGSVELYELRPPAPARPREGTLGIMIGERDLWGQGYGRDAVQALLNWAFVVHSPPFVSVRLRTFAHNKRAQRAFLAAGFYEEAREQQRDRVDVLMRAQRDVWLAREP